MFAQTQFAFDFQGAHPNEWRRAGLFQTVPKTNRSPALRRRAERGEWHGWMRMIPDHKRFNLGYIAHRTALADPERVAVLAFCGGLKRVITYGELDARLDRLAAGISALGLPQGPPVASLAGHPFAECRKQGVE